MKMIPIKTNDAQLNIYLDAVAKNDQQLADGAYLAMSAVQRLTAEKILESMRRDQDANDRLYGV